MEAAGVGGPKEQGGEDACQERHPLAQPVCDDRGHDEQEHQAPPHLGAAQGDVGLWHKVSLSLCEMGHGVFYAVPHFGAARLEPAKIPCEAG